MCCCHFDLEGAFVFACADDADFDFDEGDGDGDGDFVGGAGAAATDPTILRAIAATDTVVKARFNYKPFLKNLGSFDRNVLHSP